MTTAISNQSLAILAVEAESLLIRERFSFFDLRELSDDDLDRGEAMLKKPTGVEVLDCGTSENLIDWWRVESDDNVYYVRRFANFCYCSCPDFYFKKTACKHLAVTTPATCSRCHKAVEVRGDICLGCHAATAIYIKQEKPVERVNGMRI